MTELLNLATVAKELQVSVPAIRRLIDRGKIPNSKIFGRVLIERTELDEFIRLSRRLTAADAAAYNKDIHHTAGPTEATSSPDVKNAA